MMEKLRLFNRKSRSACWGSSGVGEGFLEAVSLMPKDIPKGEEGKRKGADG